MKRSELARLVAEIASQPGVRVRKTGKSGWFFYLPDGSMATLHSSQSDHRSMKNFEAIITKSGTTYPSKKRSKP